MKLYGISGLGADERVYEALSFDCDFIFIEWVDPKEKESLYDYAIRLSKVIDTTEEFGLIGVSFGGLVISEMVKFLNPEFVILVSSVEFDSELKEMYKTFGNTKINQILPEWFYDLPTPIAKFLFGTSSPLLSEILDDMDLSFTKWAVNELLNWKNSTKIKNLYRIHGTEDKFFSCPPKEDNVNLIDGGGHFTIVDDSEKVNVLINKIISLN